MKSFKQFFLEEKVNPIDAEYFAALEANDLNKADQLVRKYASEKGYNTLAWHGTPIGRFEKFRISKSFGSLYFFAKTKEYARYYAERFTGSPSPTVMDVLLKMENPLQVEEFEPEGVKAAYELRKKGYDSVETPNALIVFLPDQIKSADTVTYDKKGNVVPLSKRFNEESDLINEYRHDYADGTPSQSIRPNNSKNPDRVGPDKKYLHTVGPYQRENPKMKVPGSILTAKELADMDIEYSHGKIMDNWKNSGFGLEMTSINGEPVARVFKSNPRPVKAKPHLSITK